ncbi:PD-(D/E)XK nuclease family protein [Flagellimonas sp. S3867]|uniref:PD-(D/E)XK nuclease family protein n=1 Tax=Flagellimonas sp. S3867 TaxID=2768063 RepID=UPI001CC2574A|nr:PD-(D/E)XK nuclease family protein [Flagellimonas sp. S3867]
MKKHLSSRISKNIFAPQILSIEDFIANIAGISTTSSIDLLLLLFKAYKKTRLKRHDDFNSFLKWGQTLIQDFNEIDRYLIPADDILNYLSAIKDLSHWSLKSEKTELVQNYLQLWNQLEFLYNTFTASLLEKNKGYQGLVYKTAVANLETYSEDHQTNSLIFVGFNALNTAESRIIQHLLHQPQNHIYWDIDAHFLNDKIHDAGLFIRGYQQEWPYYDKNEILGVHNSFLDPKKISITGVPKSISQAKYVGNLLNTIGNDSQNQLKNTALVLADETLLNPILKAIPSNIEEANITMGLSLNKTVLYSFFMSFLELNISKTERGWFYTDVLEFLSNPYTYSITQSEEFVFLKSLSVDIKKNNWIYLNTPIISKYSPSGHAVNTIFPEKIPSPSQWIDNCLDLIQHLKSYFQTSDNALELEYLYRFYALFNQLHVHLEDVDFITNLKSLKSFFKQLASAETLDFIGEPLSGLQIMGMLESRNLDFETVILTSVNEGILPSGKSNNSFIPFDVKREYGLPTYKEKDAIYTYHFYRLIQRAKHIHIIYNTEPDVLEGGEKSRLISQLLTDEAIASYISHNIASPEVKIAPYSPVEVIKTLLQKEIKTLAQTGFSPTSLTNYIRNPIDFYKRNILKINDTDEVEESIAANTFGTIVHDSLEQLYSPFLDQFLTPEKLSEAILLVPNIVQQNFKKLLPGADLKKGRFLLVFNVVIKYLKNFIELEKSSLTKHQIRILELEKKYEVELHFSGLGFPVKLKGTLDRVDEIDGVTRIVDYKTGRVDPKNVKVLNWEELITDYDKSKAFQLLCYSLLFTKEKNTVDLLAGIYSFKNLGQGFLSFTSDGTSISSETLRTFQTFLEKLVLEICNPSIPFTEKEI